MSNDTEHEQPHLPGMAPGEVDGDQMEEDHGYDIKPAEADGTVQPTGPERAITAFVVYINEEGKAIADSNLDRLKDTEVRRPAGLEDFLRASLEVSEDVRRAMSSEQTAHLTAQAQAQAAQAIMKQQREMQEQAHVQQLLQNGLGKQS